MANTYASELLTAVREFRPHILAEVDVIESGRRIPEALAQQLGRLGVFRATLPKVYGGFDLSPLQAMEVFEELALADASVAWCAWNANAHWTTARLAPHVAQTVFADPAMLLANSTRPSGRATVVDGGYRVSGRWSLVSACQLSSWLILLCAVYEGDKQRLTPAGATEYRFMLCPTSAGTIIDTWTVGGLRGTGSHDVQVDDCFVANDFASFHSDAFVLTDPRYHLPPMSRIAPGLGMIALGIARRAINALVSLSNEKRHERTGQAVSEDRGAQMRLAQAEALVLSARLYLIDATRQVWDLSLSGQEISHKQRADVRLASCNAVTSAVQAVDLIYQAGGATSLYASSPIERAFRDVHAVAQHIAVHPRLLEASGRMLFGLAPDASTPML